MIGHLHKIEELEWELGYVKLERNNLLARIFRDGGQRASQLGGRAVEEAEKIVANLFGENDWLRDRVGVATEALETACIASCECQTKTPNPEYHAETCRYRKLRAAIDRIHVVDYYCPDCRDYFRAPREPGPHPKQVACPKGHVHNTYEACRD